MKQDKQEFSWTWRKGIPLFQLYSFLTRLSPLTLKGPCSRKADATDEQPGPKKREEAHGQTPKRSKMYTINRKRIRDLGDIIKADAVILPPFSQRTRGFEPGCDSASTKQQKRALFCFSSMEMQPENCWKLTCGCPGRLVILSSMRKDSTVIKICTKDAHIMPMTIHS